MSQVENGTSSSVQEEANLIDAEVHMRALKLEESAKAVKFRFVEKISKTYELGNEVMPSASGTPNLDKPVLFAKRKRDNLTVVIKMRNKQTGFKDNSEREDWLAIMKLLYHISGGENQDKGKSNLKSIANVVDILEDEKCLYGVMDYVRGRDLFDYFIQEKTYKADYKLSLGRQIAKNVCRAVDELHSYGLIHKDLKLENFVLDESAGPQQGPDFKSVIKIIDFDTVEIYKPGTKAFHVLGTDQYIAPETYAGYSSPASDMWAIGVIMYTVLSGSFPFHCALFDDQPGENYVGHVRMDQIRRRLRIARIDWSSPVWAENPAVKEFVRNCLQCDPARRMKASESLQNKWLTEG